jgi:hypothetical protein
MKRHLDSALLISEIATVTPSAMAKQFISVARSDGVVYRIDLDNRQ